MIYVDENLCTACGVCVDTCDRGAISVGNRTASIDPTLCVSCGRCVDVCMTGAIISVEPVDSLPEPVALSSTDLSPSPSAPSQWPASRVSPAAPESKGTPLPARSPGASKLDIIERVLAGIFSIADYALARRQTGRTGVPSRSSGTGVDFIPSGGRRGGCAGGQRQYDRGPGSGSGRGLGSGSGPRGGRRQGGGQGRRSQCRSSRRDPST